MLHKYNKIQTLFCILDRILGTEGKFKRGGGCLSIFEFYLIVVGMNSNLKNSFNSQFPDNLAELNPQWEYRIPMIENSSLRICIW